MYTTVVWVSLILIYEMVIRLKPLPLLPFRSLAFNSTEKEEREVTHFDLLALLEAVESQEFGQATGAGSPPALNLSLSVDRPDALYFDEMSHLLVYAYIGDSNETHSQVLSKAISLHGDTLQDIGLHFADCLKSKVAGRALALFYSGNKLVVHSVAPQEAGAPQQFLTVVQVIDCYHARIGHHWTDGEHRDLNLQINISHLVFPHERIKEVHLHRELLLVRTATGRSFMVGVYAEEFKQLLPQRIQCQNILKAFPLKDKIIAICYEITGLKIRTELVVVQVNSPRRFDSAYNRQPQHLVMHREYFPGHGQWARESDYLADSDSILFASHAGGQIGAVITKDWVFWLLEDRQFSFKHKILKEQSHMFRPESVFFSNNNQMWVASVNRAGLKVLDCFSLEFNLDLDSSSHHGHLFTASLPATLNKHLAAIEHLRSTYLLTFDHAHGILVSYLISDLPWHATYKKMGSFVGKCFKYLMYCFAFEKLVYVVFAFLKRYFLSFRNGEGWSIKLLWMGSSVRNRLQGRKDILARLQTLDEKTYFSANPEKHSPDQLHDSQDLLAREPGFYISEEEEILIDAQTSQFEFGHDLLDDHPSQEHIRQQGLPQAGGPSDLEHSNQEELLEASAGAGKEQPGVLQEH